MALHQIYSSKCKNITLYLKEILPSDVVHLIANVCWNLRSDPVLVFLVCEKNKVMSEVFDAWREIKEDIPKTHPRLRTRQMKFGFISSSTFMSTICDECAKVPIWLLIPGSVWDRMMVLYNIIDAETISCDSSELNIRYAPNGVKHCNGTIWPDDSISCSLACNNYASWIRTSINDNTFIKAQGECSSLNKFFITSKRSGK